MSKFNNVISQSKQAAKEKNAHHLSVLNERRKELQDYVLIAERELDGRRNKSIITKPPADYINLKTASKIIGIHHNQVVYLIHSGKLNAKKYKSKRGSLAWHVRLIDIQRLADNKKSICKPDKKKIKKTPPPPGFVTLRWLSDESGCVFSSLSSAAKQALKPVKYWDESTRKNRNYIQIDIAMSFVKNFKSGMPIRKAAKLARGE